MEHFQLDEVFPKERKKHNCYQDATKYTANLKPILVTLLPGA